MTSQRVSQLPYKNNSIDLSAFLVAIGYTVNVTVIPGEYRATFEVKQTRDLFNDIAGYESGAMAPAKRLLNTRSRLFREASAVVKGGTE